MIYYVPVLNLKSSCLKYFQLVYAKPLLLTITPPHASICWSVHIGKSSKMRWVYFDVVFLLAKLQIVWKQITECDKFENKKIKIINHIRNNKRNNKPQIEPELLGRCSRYLSLNIWNYFCPIISSSQACIPHLNGCTFTLQFSSYL